MNAECQDVEEHALAVRRTARYYTAGTPLAEARAVWVVLHGYGQQAERFASRFAPVTEAGGCVVAPEALSRFYTEGTGGQVGASWMTSADRDAEIEDYLGYLDALAGQLFTSEEEKPLLHLLGFSQGAATAARWAAHCLEAGRPVRQLTLWAGGLPPDVAPAALAQTKLALAVGTRDGYVTPERLDVQQQRLDEANASYELLRFDGGHRLDDDTLRRLVETWEIED